ncbi:MAG TPA: hypothetical protein ENI64_02810 [Gammaproteobacteria bacterium]|nr:hypothetical protein [Gammaproteobacteria bacterium]
MVLMEKKKSILRLKYKSTVPAATPGVAAIPPVITQADDNNGYSTLSYKDIMYDSGPGKRPPLPFCMATGLVKRRNRVQTGNNEQGSEPIC